MTYDELTCGGGMTVSELIIALREVPTPWAEYQLDRELDRQ